jgi:hypothetical protein
VAISRNNPPPLEQRLSIVEVLADIIP